METVVLSAQVEFISQKFVKPLILSSGPITVITEARATVTVQVNGVEATGIGSIYLSDLWAWPDPALTHEQRDAHLRAICTEVASILPEWCQPAAHPLELGLRLHHEVGHGNRLTTPPQGIPPLALALCISPFDAAIHDAVGKALQCSAFSIYEEDAPIPSADRYFAGGSATAAIRAVLRKPVDALDAWWIVGAKDDLPAAFELPVCKHGYHCFKVKLLGKDIAQDIERTIEIYDAAVSLGCKNPRISLDSNEGNKDSDEVLQYLQTLRERRSDVFEALAYLEQPTGRDITVHAFDWREASRLKPILLDEGLTDLELLPLARQQGWSGLALKTCKGHSFNLVAAAWAHENHVPMAMQDLTNPGYAAIHSFLFAAHVPVINGVELNSFQYTPAANEAWLPRLAGLFQPTGGQHRLSPEGLIGLGSNL